MKRYTVYATIKCLGQEVDTSFTIWERNKAAAKNVARIILMDLKLNNQIGNVECWSMPMKKVKQQIKEVKPKKQEQIIL